MKRKDKARSSASSGWRSHSLRGEIGAVLAELLRSGMSPGGAQPKALLAIAEDFSEIRLDERGA